MRAARRIARDAERRFPVRIRIAVPDRGLGDRLNQMHERLDQNVGADGWVMTPSARSPSGPLVGSAGMRGVLNDAISIHQADATIASAFIARWCPAIRPRRQTGYSESGRMSQNVGLACSRIKELQTRRSRLGWGMEKIGRCSP
jgi:hypothetical protein